MSQKLLESIKGGDRRALAQAMTLIESTREDHRQQADELLDQLDLKSSNSLRIGISGSPGVGKSTFVEAFGSYLIHQGHSVAVLAIDPTSPLTQGSILADKTRMPKLSSSPQAFIRPSPSAGTLGGVAARTREITSLCEAAGFDIILIETVGVGQSEVTVSHLTDMLFLLLPPAGGDELQGIKKGIVEMADLILVNKCDGALKASAEQAISHYKQAVSLLRHKPHVEGISALQSEGLDKVWGYARDLKNKMVETGAWEKRRQEQTQIWFDDTLKEELWQHFERLHHEEITALKAELSLSDIPPVKIVHKMVHRLLK